MSHIHVCLVSDQTIPNILGIYHFKPEKIIFCSTDRMEKEGKTDAIMNTLKLCGLDYSIKSEKILVDQDCLEDCESKFNNEIAEKYINDKMTVNLTGGTKIMVLGAYKVLSKLAEQMIYTPIPKNEFVVVYPREGTCKSPASLSLRFSVEAYVTAYGVKVKNSNKLEQLKSNAKRNEKLCQWMVHNYNAIEYLLGELYGQLKGRRDDKNYGLELDYMPKNGKERELKSMLKLAEGNIIRKTLTKNEIRFLTGDWLSDYCFNEISRLSVDDCITGIELLSSQGADNEFDVMFTKDNALYIVECKSLKQKHDKDADILYKISALQDDFGLRVDGFLVSTARNIIDTKGNIKEHILRRSKQCKTNVIHPDEISRFSAWIKNKVKGL